MIDALQVRDGYPGEILTPWESATMSSTRQKSYHVYSLNLEYSHDKMIQYKPPPTRKKPTDTTDAYDVTMNIVVKTDCDLAGQTETRQTTTSLMAWVSGALVHWRAHTERIIIPSTAAGEYVARLM